MTKLKTTPGIRQGQTKADLQKTIKEVSDAEFKEDFQEECKDELGKNYRMIKEEFGKTSDKLRKNVNKNSRNSFRNNSRRKLRKHFEQCKAEMME